MNERTDKEMKWNKCTLGFVWGFYPIDTGEVSFHFSSIIGQSGNSVRQQGSSSSFNARLSQHQGPYGGERAKSRPTPNSGFSQIAQQSSHKPPISTNQYSQQSKPLPPTETTPKRPSVHTSKPPNNSWKFTNSFELPNSSFVEKRSSNPSQSIRPTVSQVEMYKMHNDTVYRR